MSAAGVGVFRADIQGIRAIAVLTVLVYHIWPTWLPGGYIGVDVFFVLSGYLITGLLVRELEKNGAIGLRDFYARRIRRLLPASSIVLFAVAAATVIWMPVADWRGVARELVASAFYAQNLLLVGQQVDYLAADAAPSPLLHFWSLAVEEQYYIVWPLIMISVAALARQRSWPLRTALFLALASISLLSLVHGIYMSFTAPAPGYFLTTTRIWELGVGGLLALGAFGGRIPAGSALRKALGWAGLFGIVLSAVFYSNRLPFPGYEALLPTLSAAVLIFAAPDRASLLGRSLAYPSVQYLGGISYSLYLWHWPIIVFYPLVTGRLPDTLQDGVFIIVVSIFCAAMSRRFVEERFRHSRAGEIYRPYAFAALLTLGVATASLLIVSESSDRASTGLEISSATVAHPGAMAVSPGKELPVGEEFIPEAGLARLDRGSAYGLDGRSRCIVDTLGTEPAACDYGLPGSATRIIIVGDSHAVHWLPAMELIAERAGWRITGLTKSSCAFTDELLAYFSGSVSRDYSECRVWGRAVLQEVVRQKPDLVIISHSPRQSPFRVPRGEGSEAVARGIIRNVDVLHRAGIKVAAIAHTPWQKQDVPQCLSRPGGTIESCSTPENQAVQSGSIGLAASYNPNIPLIDLGPYFCSAEVCPVVIGGVLVYRDAHHLTATYSRTLAPVLEQRIREQLSF